jgi:uncharacterized damage-inducible protein DinB
MNQDALRTRLSIELEAVTRDARTAAAGLSDEQLQWSDGSGWSIAQIFEHLVLSTDAYVAKIRGRIFSPNAVHVAAGTEAEWEPSLMGWMLVRRMRSPRPLPAPRIFMPGPTPRADVVNAFAQRQKTFTYLLRASSALYWSRVRATSPVSAWIRMNLGDAFTVLIVHQQRHVGQMDRVRQQMQFPAEVRARA